MKNRKVVKCLTIVILLASLQGFAAEMIQADGSPTTSSIRWGITTKDSTGANEDVERRESVWLHCGDWVAKDDDSKWQNKFFGLEYKNTLETMHRLSIMGCRGNYEYKAFIYGKYWPYTKAVEETTVTVPAPEKHYYSFDYGSVYVAIIDNQMKYVPGLPQYTWLVADLKSSTKPWTIYGAQYYNEASQNDGSINNKQKTTITAHDASFGCDVVSGSYIITENLSDGLATSFVRDSDTQLIMSFKGKARKLGVTLTNMNNSSSVNKVELNITYNDGFVSNIKALSLALKCSL